MEKHGEKKNGKIYIDVAEIKKLKKSGSKHQDLARDLGLSSSALWARITSGNSGWSASAKKQKQKSTNRSKIAKANQLIADSEQQPKMIGSIPIPPGARRVIIIELE